MTKKTLRITHVHLWPSSNLIQVVAGSKMFWGSYHNSKIWRLKSTECSRPGWTINFCKVTLFSTSVMYSFLCWTVLMMMPAIATRENRFCNFGFLKSILTKNTTIRIYKNLKGMRYVYLKNQMLKLLIWKKCWLLTDFCVCTICTYIKE